MSNTAPRVYVLLLNWNGWRDTCACLEALFRLDYPSLRVIVCDNASADGSMDRLQAWAAGDDVGIVTEAPLAHLVLPVRHARHDSVTLDRPTAERGGDLGTSPAVTFIQTGANLGFAGGCNVGLRHVLARNDAEYVWLLNSDTLVPPDSLRALVERARATPQAGIVGSVVLHLDRPDVVQALGGFGFSAWTVRAWPIGAERLRASLAAPDYAEAEAAMRYVVGASMLVSVPFLRDIGLMYEGYFLYFEELDWAERARRHRGVRYGLALAPGSLVYHKLGASAGSGRSLFSLRYLYRNHLVFMKRFFPRRLWLARLKMLWEATKSAARRQPDEVKLFLSLALSRVIVPTDAALPGKGAPC